MSVSLIVSSRAPVWGASRGPYVPGTRDTAVSSRAPVWGASHQEQLCQRRGTFQVVPPCGGHLLRTQRLSDFVTRFKSCPRVGGIRWYRCTAASCDLFQVVPPCGGHLG